MKRSPQAAARGEERIRVRLEGSRKVQELRLEDYVAGVVASEMPASYPPEALKAQAVAARGYAFSHLKPNNNYDVTPTASNQVYSGYQHEDPRSDQAVAETANQVLIYTGSDQRYYGKVIEAFFHSDAGGYTENSEYAFVSGNGSPGTKVPYLRGKPDVDPNGVPYDIDTPNYSWQTGQFTMSQLSAIMALNPLTDVGQITNITFFRGVSGRAYQILLEGTEGSLYMSGGRFKSQFNNYKPPGSDLKSNMFYLTLVTS